MSLDWDPFDFLPKYSCIAEWIENEVKVKHGETWKSQISATSSKNDIKEEIEKLFSFLRERGIMARMLEYLYTKPGLQIGTS